MGAVYRLCIIIFDRDILGSRTSLTDHERLGRPKTATTSNNIEKILLGVRRIEVRKIAEAMDISKEQVWHIVTNSHTEVDTKYGPVNLC